MMEGRGWGGGRSRVRIDPRAVNTTFISSAPSVAMYYR